MLTKFFSQSKPIVLFFLIVFSWIALGFTYFYHPSDNFTWYYLVAAAVCVSFIIFLERFIISKNKINKQNSFGLTLFVFGIISLLPLIDSFTTWLVLLFVGLFFRRVISMLNETMLKKKTFEASFWLILASFFEPNLILLIVLIWLANIIISVNQLANYLIPIISFAATLLIANAVTILKDNKWFNLYDYILQIQLDLSWEFDLSFMFILCLVVLSFFSFPGFLRRAQVLKKIQLNLLIISSLFVLLLISFFEVFSNSLYIISLYPLVPLGGEFFQLKIKHWLKESLWWVFIALSLFCFITKLI